MKLGFHHGAICFRCKLQISSNHKQDTFQLSSGFFETETRASMIPIETRLFLDLLYMPGFHSSGCSYGLYVPQHTDLH